MSEKSGAAAITTARWSACRTTTMSYIVPPLTVPIVLGLPLVVISYALN